MLIASIFIATGIGLWWLNRKDTHIPQPDRLPNPPQRNIPVLTPDETPDGTSKLTASPKSQRHRRSF